MTDSVPFYSLPDTNSEKLSNWIYKELYNINIYFLVKGTELTILEKTQKVETIDGKTDCWYYVRIFAIDTYYHGWFFGKNFEKYDESKKGEYKKILEKEIVKLKK